MRCREGKWTSGGAGGGGGGGGRWERGSCGAVVVLRTLVSSYGG